MNSVNFPTQGEVIQFVFDAFGVLPRKNDDDASFDETRKKSIQKALQRLAAEECALSQRFGEMLQTLSYLIAGSIPPRECLVIGETLCDLLDVYQDTLRDEGTFLSKSETVKWFLLDSVVFKLPMSIAKHFQRYNVAADGLVAPADTFWYLPTNGSDGWVWPLEKVMRWAYELAGTSIQKFHWPDADLTDQEKNLESAKKWLAGRHVPSWPTLLKNFNQSFDALENDQSKRDRHPLSETQKNSIRMALFIARASTHISQSVLSHYGDAVLQEFCSHFQTVTDCVGDDVQRIRDYVQHLIARNGIPSNEWDHVWFDVSTEYWKQFADQLIGVFQGLQQQQITISEAAEISRRFGRFAALRFETPEQFAPKHSTPQGFEEALFDGLALQKSADLSNEKTAAYAERLNDLELGHVLPWIVPWQQATYHYRAERYLDAYPFIQDAFEKAQYCAGRHQYLLVNQYIELAAKNDKLRDFKRGIEWATYLGLEVRWLRQDEPTEEKLQFVFEIMKKAVYSI
ncbi:MAG: hypothetical protein Q8O85_09090 [Rhodoferax sp.]|uniref:hypothetical protein n=1 Tax=Rhodoferax sp. TaxID=50421 RepID=UPI00273614D3|nr:hypothetical protein [Rhodoferax sp.]MDP2678863.1 hypothetical protein [Rhodoferax sp.]